MAKRSKRNEATNDFIRAGTFSDVSRVEQSDFDASVLGEEEKNMTGTSAARHDARSKSHSNQKLERKTSRKALLNDRRMRL